MEGAFQKQPEVLDLRVDGALQGLQPRDVCDVTPLARQELHHGQGDRTTSTLRWMIEKLLQAVVAQLVHATNTRTSTQQPAHEHTTTRTRQQAQERQAT
jgi:hypothetical protein